MKQLSSNLSQPRRRIYSLLFVGVLVAFVTSLVGGLIFFLGRSRPDIIMPFWECGEYVLLLGVANLSLYGALFWQVHRLSRRERRKSAPESPSVLLAPAANASFAPSSPSDTTPAAGQPSGSPRRVSRQVRGTLSSLNLDP